ncbi:hypothetical protein D3C83_246410 [compost metagenome]
MRATARSISINGSTKCASFFSEGSVGSCFAFSNASAMRETPLAGSVLTSASTD